MHTAAELIAERDQLLTRASALIDAAQRDGRDLTDEEAGEHTRACDRLANLTPLITRAQQLDRVRAAAASPSNREGGFSAGGLINRTDPFDGSDWRTLNEQQIQSRALAVVERSGDLVRNTAVADTLDRVIRSRTDDLDGDYIARRLLLTENPAYRSAFQKYAASGGQPLLTNEETAAVLEFQRWTAQLSRAMNEGTSSAGGYGVPVMVDPSVIITSGAADAPILRIARVETITTQAWKGISSAGMSWSFDTEASAVSDDSPTIAQPSVTAYLARGFLPYSVEVGMDYPNFAIEMQRILMAGYIDLLAVKTSTGTGTNEPRGVFTALDANTNVEVVTTTDGSFGGADVFKVWNALPERWRSRATWFMSTSVESAIRQFAAAAGGASAYFTVDLTQDGISRINGRPVALSDYAPTFSGAVPGTTGAANILAVGDFSNYLIASRAGMSIEMIPHLFDTTNNRPTSQRGMLGWARIGADSINDLGLRLLQNA